MENQSRADAVATGHGNMPKAIFHLERDLYRRDKARDKDVSLGKISTPEGNRFGWTLEDTVRPYGIKDYGETAIPATKGDFTYYMDLHYSQKYKNVVVIYTRKEETDRGTIYYLEYGGITFSMIYVHGGNDDEDTKGCVLCAKNRFDDTLGIQGSLKSEFYDLVKEYKDKGFDTRLRVTNLPQKK